MVKSCWRKEGNGGKQPEQPRQHEPPTYGTDGTLAATPNLPPAGSSRASTSVGQTGTISLNGHRHPRQHRPHLPRSLVSSQCAHRGPTTCPQNDSDSDDDDNDLVNKKAAEILAKEQQRLARRRAIQARYRARHPERVAEQKRRYRAKYPERVVEQRRRYQARHPDRIAEQGRRYREKQRTKCLEKLRQYYHTHGERLRAYQREYWRSEKKQVWWRQQLAQRREATTLLARQRGPMVQKRTEEKRQALGPLKLTVTLEDFMEDVCNTLSPTPEDSVDQPSTPTIMDMDSGVLDPLDHSVCDMWDDGRGFLDNLLEELCDLWSPSLDASLCDSSSSSDDSLSDSSSSDDSLFELLRDVLEYEGTPQDSCFNLDHFVR